ncbi:MAG: thiamine pyrophosphate-dependent dehydrogenase E1 component subunit alpha, partial [Oscillospiraceae bacterium]|nr:thiamine pyrophosphate-dependent dehydrogenase E1 component subunit alpha [Oscillospiraceae bacterium]
MPKSQFVDPVELRKAGKIEFQDMDVNVYNKTIKEERKNFSDDDLKRIYRDITILREFETMINLIKVQGAYNGIEHTYPGPAHLSIGQEASAVGQAYILDKDDFIFGSHRSHSEILAKALSCIHKLDDAELMDIMKNFLGGKLLKTVEEKCKSDNVKDLARDFILYGALTEIFARENGFHMGLGGSMHAFFQPFGIYPNNAIVGGSGTIATGAALYKKVNYKKGIVVANVGDGALARGPMWEAMTFASMDQFRQLWEESKRGGMPILFNCFNNDYGMGGQTRGETMGYNMLARIGAGVSPTQLHAERVDGYNPLAVIDAMKRKKEILLNGDGPCFLDVVTYRVAGHSPSDSSSYRTKEEIDAWKAIDPVIKFREDLVAAGVGKDEDYEKILKETSDVMTKICKLASDAEVSPYIDFDKDPAVVERLMFSNEKIAKMDDREPEVLMPKEECPRVIQNAGKERFAFKDGKPVSKLKTFNYRDALFEAIVDKYYEDPTLISYGEDVRDWGG